MSPKEKELRALDALVLELEAYIKRLIAAGNYATEYSTEHRQRVWRDAVNSKETT